MKLAEALLLRADLTKKLASLRERIGANAKIQEGDKPREDPLKLMKEAFGVLDELRDLTVRVHRTNLRAKLQDGRTLTEVIAARDDLAQRHSLLISAAKGSEKEDQRYSYREIKWVSVVDVAKMHKQADDVAGQLRVLNALLQEANWKVALED